MRLAGWGRFPAHEARVRTPRDMGALCAAVREGGAIARGAGRAYGDSAVSCANTIDMRRFDRLLAFDPAEGRLVAEAGATLEDVIAATLPRGWFPAVTPGTRLVTLGGMIAADVHGKNHHRDGSLRGFVDWIDVVDGAGDVRRLSAAEDPELFAWTIGGMGLTGVILRACLRLRPVETGWIRQTTVPASGLDAAMDAFEAAAEATYSVAWIDCLASGRALGRALVMAGEHARLDELGPAERDDRFALDRRRGLAVPLDLPSWALSGAAVRAFNAAYWRRGRARGGVRLVDWDGYFYPLDGLRDWNRIYGRRGFVQFQCVLPLAASRAGLAALLAAIGGAGKGSFLAVLKRLGPEAGPFSFPMEGYTLAVDFPLAPATLPLLARLDEIAIDHGGRFYLAKDARLSAAALERSDRRVAGFRAMRAARGLGASFSSAQAERLGL